MSYTRRHFSKLLQAAAAALAVGPAASASVLSNPGPFLSASSRLLTADFFAPLQGAEFRVRSANGGSACLSLVTVESVTKKAEGKPRTPDVECVTLRFEAAGAELPAGNYLFESAKAPSFELYITPGRPGRYRASLAHVPEDFLAGVSIPRRKPVVPPVAPAQAAQPETDAVTWPPRIQA